MNGALALVIALVTYGNQYLSIGKPIHPLNLNNSTLIYNCKLSFNNGASLGEGKDIANDPQEWFAFLKKDGCKKLNIYYQHSKNNAITKDFEMAGFVNGRGEWIVEAVYDKFSNYWGFKETVANPKATDNRIWQTNFFVIKHKPSRKKSVSINTAKVNLSRSLVDIEAFAEKTNQNEWAGIFKKANEMLNSKNPVVEYYKDFIPPNTLSLQATQLLFSASQAYVFGGMGSWDDHIYSNNGDNTTNDKLTEELYDKVNYAIVASLNN